MHCGHQIFRIRLSHVNWNLSSFFCSAAFSFHASHPYSRTGHTMGVNNLNFVFRPMLRVFRAFIKLKDARCALLKHFLMFSVPPPSFVSRTQIYKLFDVVSRLPLFQLFLCLLLVYSFSSLCIFGQSVSVPLFLHYLPVGWSCSVCARILMKTGLYRLQSRGL